MLLLAVCVGTALSPHYTISPQNKLTTRATTTEGPKLYYHLQERNWTRESGTGQIHCDTEEKTVSNCDLLVVLNDELTIINEQQLHTASILQKIEAHLHEVLGQLQEVRGGIHNRPPRSTKAATALKAVQNATSQILSKLDSLKNREALAATIQVFQLLLFLGYLLVLAILCAVKKCKKDRARQVEEEVELMESRLQDRKARRRAAAAKKAGQETQ